MATVWEVRPGVGSDTACGGGFVAGASGTDYSQQNAAQYTFSDLASISSLVVASASHNFVAADVGNIMQITAGTGFTTGFYQIVSVSANQATLDRSPGTVGVGGTYAVGGALATISQAYAASVDSNIIWVKASGTYTVTAALTIASVTNHTPISFIGYTTTRGDGGRVTWTTATNSTSLIKFGSPGANFFFANFTFTNTAGTPATCFDGGLTGQSYGLRISNCSFSGFSVAIGLGYVNSVHYNLGQLEMDSCEVKNSTSHGVNCSGGTYLTACYIHDNGGSGIYVSLTGSNDQDYGPVVIDRCAIWNNTVDGISSEKGGVGGNRSPWLIVTNSAIGSNGSDGIELQGGIGAANAQGLIAINNVIESNGAYGIVNDSPDSCAIPILMSNAFRANTSGNYSGAGMVAQASDVALSAEPFTSPSTGNFTLNSTAGGGTACKGAGFPTVLG